MVLGVTTMGTGDGGQASSTGALPVGSSTSGAAETSSVGEESSSSTGGPDPSVCGNDLLEPGEICDGDRFGDASCESLGFVEGTLICNDICTAFSTEQCFVCGNNLREADEECDGDIDPKTTCETMGYTAGTLACDARTCRFDTSACTRCGDNTAEGAEACDGRDLAGASCESIGFEGGQLACVAQTCDFDFAGCEGGSYTQDFEGDGLPPEFTVDGAAGWIVVGATEFTQPINGAHSARSGEIGHSEVSRLFLDVTFAASGTVSFSHREHSELNDDFLRFFIDGALQGEWSGETANTPEIFDVEPGTHQLEWRYIKDSSFNGGFDWVWIDDIVLTGGIPSPSAGR